MTDRKFYSDSPVLDECLMVYNALAGIMVTWESKEGDRVIKGTVAFPPIKLGTVRMYLRYPDGTKWGKIDERGTALVLVREQRPEMAANYAGRLIFPLPNSKVNHETGEFIMIFTEPMPAGLNLYIDYAYQFETDIPPDAKSLKEKLYDMLKSRGPFYASQDMGASLTVCAYCHTVQTKLEDAVEQHKDDCQWVQTMKEYDEEINDV